MRLVIVESPFRADNEADFHRNLTYLDLCLRDSILRSESPYASHKLIPGALDDVDPAERDLGIKCGYAWWRAASLIAYYVDLGWSNGMIQSFRHSKTYNIRVTMRSLYDANSPNGHTDPGRNSEPPH